MLIGGREGVAEGKVVCTELSQKGKIFSFYFSFYYFFKGGGLPAE